MGFETLNFELPKSHQQERLKGNIEIKDALDDLRMNTPEENRERWEKYLHLMEEVISYPESFLDKGGAGDVYHFGESGVCIKITHERHNSKNAHLYNLGNTVEEEARILAHVCGMEVEGVYVPEFVEYIPGNRYGIIVMKELDAVNLQRVLNGDQELPENFDYDDFFERLEIFVDEMHVEKGIAHGDLEAKNVMIDRQTGLPRVIDFGRSKRLEKMSSNMQNEAVKKDWDTFGAMSVLCKEKLT